MFKCWNVLVERQKQITCSEKDFKKVVVSQTIDFKYVMQLDKEILSRRS